MLFFSPKFPPRLICVFQCLHVLIVDCGIKLLSFVLVKEFNRQHWETHQTHITNKAVLEWTCLYLLKKKRKHVVTFSRKVDAQHSLKVCCYCDVLELNWINYLTVIFNRLWLFFLIDWLNFGVFSAFCTFLMTSFHQYYWLLVSGSINKPLSYLRDYELKPYSGGCMCTIR